MYEAEINQPRASELALLPAIHDAFRNSSGTITGRTVLPWGEHCTECAIPACYQTCDLYVRRKDGKCRRFANGMVRIDHDGSLSGYILEIHFKRWAKLWTVGNTRIYPLEEAKALEDQDLDIAGRLSRISNPPFQIHQIRKRYDDKKSWAAQPTPETAIQPDYFLIECYNPSPSIVSISLLMQPLAPERKMTFQQLIEMPPGFNRIKVPLAEITPVLNTAEPFGVDIIPNSVKDFLVLYFGTMDFVRDSAFVSPAAQCKVVVWDLDNTIWEGILAEDGLENLVLKSEIREVLTELDRRGIILSIASKNNAEDAQAALRKFGLEEYFLYTHISWIPKAVALSQIAAALNVGLDSMAFVDDSAFERASVRSAHPEVRVVDASEYQNLLSRPELRGAATAESAGRKELYGVQQLRDATLTAYDGTYLDFLRDCRLELTIASLSADNIDRVHELTQRTNQMNFSGNRYTREKLDAILDNPQWDTYVMDCRDRFGIYGTIGFCLVDRPAKLVTDLMFSCRIQSKQVEHAFLIYLLQSQPAKNASALHVNYRRTPRNANVAKVFDDLGFELLHEEGGLSVFAFQFTREIPANDIVNMVLHPGA